MRKILLISAAAAAVTLSAAAAADADKDKKQSPLVDALVQCRNQTDDSARLNCYDVAVAALTDASAKGDVLVVNREDVRKTRRSLFGFNLPKLPFFGGDDSQNDEPDEIEVAIRTIRGIESGKYVISFDDGSTWQTTEAKPVAPHVGDKVTIKKAALGSYFLRISGRAVRGMRVH